jgi:site-specific DNA-methyltransferase (adenine-specific)
MTYQLLIGNNLDVLPRLPDNSVDSIVTDPPYGLGNPDPDYIIKAIQLWASGNRAHIPEGKGFMGKSWDSFVPPPAIWDECLRVLKPGGHLLAFAGTRTYDLMGISIRMAGFEIRDSIGWVYGSGFPKSLDVSKAIDKQAGAEREVLGRNPNSREQATKENTLYESGTVGKTAYETEAATPEAKQWQGWGTALKPALEPIVVARKPLIGTVAENVLTYGTGGLNIDASRIGSEGGGTHCDKRDDQGNCLGHDNAGRSTSGATVHAPQTDTVQGRWPANLILDEYTAELLDEQSGQSGTSTIKTGQYDSRSGFGGGQINIRHPDSGGASRFFYVAKASKRDRNEGLEELAEKAKVFNGKNPESAGMAEGSVEDKFTTQPSKNFHPTVKPTALMEYLVRLVTPPNGIVLDPFTGSGSTGKAAILQGFNFIGIEMTEEYVPIIEGRLKHAEAKVAEAKEIHEAQPQGLF